MPHGIENITGRGQVEITIKIDLLSPEQLSGTSISTKRTLLEQSFLKTVHLPLNSPLLWTLDTQHSLEKTSDYVELSTVSLHMKTTISSPTSKPPRVRLQRTTSIGIAPTTK